MRDLLATILWEIWSPRIQCITYFPVGKKKRWPKNKARVTALILKPTDDQKPETCLALKPLHTIGKVSSTLSSVVTHRHLKRLIQHFSFKSVSSISSIIYFKMVMVANILRKGQDIFKSEIDHQLNELMNHFHILPV